MIRYGHSQVFRFLLATKVFPFAAKCGMIELAKKSKLLDKLEFGGGKENADCNYRRKLCG